MTIQTDPSPVSTGRVPRWLTLRLQEFFRDSSTSDGAELLDQAAELFEGDLLINNGTIETDDGEQFVCEPLATDTDLDAMLRLDFLCCLLRINWRIVSTTWSTDSVRFTFSDVAGGGG